MLPNSCVGGKTGKSCFAVYVRDVQNLYQTIKLTALTSQKDFHTGTSQKPILGPDTNSGTRGLATGTS